jgi:hypothetical protein
MVTEEEQIITNQNINGFWESFDSDIKREIEISNTKLSITTYSDEKSSIGNQEVLNGKRTWLSNLYLVFVLNNFRYFFVTKADKDSLYFGEFKSNIGSEYLWFNKFRRTNK